MLVTVTERELNVCIIGAGVGGICAAVQLQRELHSKAITIFESQKDVGGVWLSNRYPGCANDIPSLLYTYSFEAKTDWPRSHASNEETCNYLKDVAVKHGVYQKIQFNTQVKSLVWSESQKNWTVTVTNENTKTEQFDFDIVICATGHFRIPNYPRQFLEFKGPILHTADWDPTVDLENKNVAVIGSGASGIQLIPAIVDKVKKPIWNFPFLRPEFEIPRSVKWILSHVPFAIFLTRLILFVIFELLGTLYRTKWNFGRKSQNICIKFLKKQIPNNMELAMNLIPQYSVGCKRIGLHNGYYPAMSRPNVKLIKEPIVSITSDSIITDDGTERKIDVLILATGFDVHQYFAPMEIIGRNEENILNTWQNYEPSTYFGVVSHSMPNLFMIEGPAADSGHISATAMIEMQVKFSLRVLKEMLRRRMRCFTVKRSAEENFMQNLKKWLKDKIQSEENCGSYYKNARSETTTLWPLTATSYWMKTRFVNFSHFEFSHCKM